MPPRAAAAANVGENDGVRRALTLAFALVLAVLALAGCGGGGGGGGGGSTGTIPTSGNAAAGATVFEDNGCGGCHTFAAAGSTGGFGPNLDDSTVTFAEAYAQVRDGGGGMPSFGDSLGEQQLANVAQYVVSEREGG